MILPRKEQNILNMSCGSEEVFMSIIPLNADTSDVGGAGL